MFFIGFPIFSYLIRKHATISIGYTKVYAKFSQSNLLSSHNTLLTKHSSHQKAESLRGASRSTATLSPMQSILNSLQNDRCSFFFTTLLMHITTPYNLYSKSVPLLWSIFISPFQPYFFTKSPLQSPLTIFPSMPQQFFNSLFLCTTQHCKSIIISLPQPFSQFRLRQGTRELGSLKRTDTALISPFLLKASTIVTGLKNHWFLFVQAQKIGVL